MEIVLTDKNFEGEVLESKILVLVDFWAKWCTPCRAVAPIVEELAQEFRGKIKVGKLNVDENPETAQRYSVLSIPTLLLFKNGEVVSRVVGVRSKQVLRKEIDKLVSTNA